MNDEIKEHKKDLIQSMYKFIDRYQDKMFNDMTAKFIECNPTNQEFDHLKGIFKIIVGQKTFQEYQ